MGADIFGTWQRSNYVKCFWKFVDLNIFDFCEIELLNNRCGMVRLLNRSISHVV